MLLYIYLCFLSIFHCFSSKNMCSYHFISFYPFVFFCWSNEFAQQNIDQSETGIGNKKLSEELYVMVFYQIHKVCSFRVKMMTWVKLRGNANWFICFFNWIIICKSFSILFTVGLVYGVIGRPPYLLSVSSTPNVNHEMV